MLTLAQAAALLGLSPSTLRNQVKAGRLRATLVGKMWTVTPREVERYRATSLGKVGRPPKYGHAIAASRCPMNSATSLTTPFPQQR